MNDKQEMLIREIERLHIIVELQEHIKTCRKLGCETCVGVRYAINIIDQRLENR